MKHSDPSETAWTGTPTEAILESISDGVFTVDGNWRVTSFNRAAEDITGIPRAEAIGKPCSDVFRSSMCECECALRQTLASGTPVVNKTGYIINAAGERVPVSVSTAMLRDSSGSVIGGAETFRDLTEVEILRRDLEGRTRIGELISRSPAMRDVFDVVRAVADSPSTVLVQGETGTGKEVVARAIHSCGPRAQKPFLAVNCGALPDTLLESELFGYRKGAFTGADADKPGRFAAASDGTLFLDEIGDVSPALQVRLLRVLQERTYEPLGGNRSEHTDARIICATNRDLGKLVDAGEFRLDLFYRVNVVRIDLPPLRARREDIPLIAEQFIERFNHLQHRQVGELSHEVLALLVAHDWPGNIRELENVIERAFVLAPGNRIDVRHLPPELGGGTQPAPGSTQLRETARTAETEAIRSALTRNGFNRAAAARELGIHPTTLYRKIRAGGLQLPEKDGRSAQNR